MTIDKATAIRDKAANELDRILEAGGDATPARAKLAEAEAALAAAQAAAAAIAKDRDESDRAEAHALADAATSEVGAALAEIVAGIAVPAPPKVDPSKALTYLAAQRKADNDRLALDETQTRRDALQERLATLSTERSAIVSRRVEGDVRDGDGSTLALLDADIEGLAALVGKVKAELAGLDLALAASTEALRAAERRWTGARGAAWLAGLRATAANIEAALVVVDEGMAAHTERRYAPITVPFANRLHAAGYGHQR
jgi:hypothetical protein